MPALSYAELNQTFVTALAQSHATALLLNPNQGNPRKFLVNAIVSRFEAWVYMWTITHGGGAKRPKDEYRIQMTAVTPPLGVNPTGPTVLIGHEPTTGAFAGFDIDKHLDFTAGSSSIQIAMGTLQEAALNGFGFALKGNDEIAVGIRPDLLLAYILNSQSLHIHGGNVPTAQLLVTAAALQPVPPAQLQALPVERQRLVATVSQLSRAHDFRKRVLQAYELRCAVTEIQLNLVDAAHILPVGAPGSTDDTSNGICLSPTFHRAFDRSLIYLDEQLRLQVNRERERELAALGVAGGIAVIRAYSGREIVRPRDQGLWPALGYIRAANEFRGIT